MAGRFGVVQRQFDTRFIYTYTLICTHCNLHCGGGGGGGGGGGDGGGGGGGCIFVVVGGVIACGGGCMLW